MFDSLPEKLRDRLKSIDKKTAVIVAASSTGLVSLVGGGIYSAPYQTLNSMKNATENRNADALSQTINFPELRVSIKKNIKAQVIKEMANEVTPEVIEKTVNPLVDQIITPEGIDRLMQDKAPETKIDLNSLGKNLAKSDVTMGYESFDRFVVHITDKVNRAKDVSLILKRDGFAWKLSGIDISKL
jgi:Protein of unknown function (DUF2939)